MVATAVAVLCVGLTSFAEALSLPQSHVEPLTRLSALKQNQEFELHVGKALDTLRDDYPRLLTENPNFDIYDPDVEVIDPSGVHVHGLKAYKNSFRVLHALVKFVYCPSRSSVGFRMCYDQARQNIRIHWNAHVVPREIFGGARTTLHVDGISVYELDLGSGNITQHRIEQLLMNDRPVAPKEGVLAALHQEHQVTVPSFINTVEFVSPWKSAPTSLFMMEAENEHPDLDWARFESKNKSRKKFGLQPLTPEEFLEVEAQVQQLAAEQQQRRVDATPSEPPPKNNFLQNLFGKVLEDTCESNYDCDRPQICCDFGFKKMCCSSGSLVANGVPQPALVPVPVETADDPRNPTPRNF